MRTLLLQIFSFSLIWIIFVLISVGVNNATFAAFIAIGLFGIIGGCTIHAIFNFFRTTERRRKIIAAITLSILIIPPVTYIFYRSYQSLKHDPRTYDCGTVVDKRIDVALPYVPRAHDKYYMSIKFPDVAGIIEFPVPGSIFGQYAWVGNDVCVNYIRAQDMSFGNYDQLLEINAK